MGSSFHSATSPSFIHVAGVRRSFLKHGFGIYQKSVLQNDEMIILLSYYTNSSLALMPCSPACPTPTTMPNGLLLLGGEHWLGSVSTLAMDIPQLRKWAGSHFFPKYRSLQLANEVRPWHTCDHLSILPDYGARISSCTTQEPTALVIESSGI